MNEKGNNIKKYNIAIGFKNNRIKVINRIFHNTKKFDNLKKLIKLIS